MYAKRFIPKPLMTQQAPESNTVLEVVQVAVQTCYTLLWDLWHTASNRLSVDTGKIYFKGLPFYHKAGMKLADCIKADKITFKVYENLLDSGLYVVTSRKKSFYSLLYNRYYETIELPDVYVRIYTDMSKKQEQEICIKLTGAQVKAISSDDYLTELNQQLSAVDDRLKAQKPYAENGWLVYKLKDDAVNFRINLSDGFSDDLGDYSIYLDHGHTLDLKSSFGGLISGPSGTGKTYLIFGLIYQLMSKRNISLYIGDGKGDQLGTVMNAILPTRKSEVTGEIEQYVYTGINCCNLVHKMYKLMKSRYKYLGVKRSENVRKLAFADFDKFNLKEIVFIIDEQNLVVGALDKKQREQYIKELVALCQGCRACGMLPILSLQHATAELITGSKSDARGTTIKAQLSGFHILMGNPAQILDEDKRAVFGNGADLPETNFKPDEKGVGFFKTDRSPGVEAFRAPYLTVDDSTKLFDLLKEASSVTD